MPRLIRHLLCLVVACAFVHDNNVTYAADYPAYPGFEKLEWLDMSFYLANGDDARLNIGADQAINDFVDLLIPVSGREKRVSFMPLSLWGKKKPPYKTFDWHRFDSQHFTFYTYPEGDANIQTVIDLFESEFDHNNYLFGVDSRFDLKVPVLFYQTREDFEQTNAIYGAIPDGLGGVTETLFWKRVVFPFEGSKSKLEHIIRHEGSHVYQIAMKPRLPLWFIEGSAETNAREWDADSETVIRDAFINDLFLPIDQLWRIRGTWLMYKTGHFITSYILREFGEEAFRAIYQNSKKMAFKNNIQASLGISIEELNRRVQREASERYNHMIGRQDFTDNSEKIGEGFLLAAANKNTLVGKIKNQRLTLELGHLDQRGKLLETRVVSDRRLGSESLRMFQGGADMDEDSLIYTVKKSRDDVIRRQEYRWLTTEKRFELSETVEFSFPGIARITDPTIIDDNTFAFIGYRQGFADLYLYHQSEKLLERLTLEQAHLTGLDYSKKHHSLVFAKEMEKTNIKSDYNYDLFLLNLDKRVPQRLWVSAEDERSPRFSHDGNQILYISDRNAEYNIGIYNFEEKQPRLVTKAKIGFPRAEWADGDNIYVGSPNRFFPQVHYGKLPHVKNRLQAMVGEQLSSSNTLLIDGFSNKKNEGTLNKKFGTIKDQQWVVDDGGNSGPQKVVAVAQVDKDIYLTTEHKHLKVGDHVSNPAAKHFWKLGEYSIDQVKDDDYVAPAVIKRVKEKLKAFLSRHTVMQLIPSPDGKLAVIRVNQLLSQEKGNAASVTYIVQMDPLTIEKIEEAKYIDDFDYRFDRVIFTDHDKLLFVVSHQKNPRRRKIRLGIFDLKTKKINWPFNSIRNLAISPDGNQVIVRQNKKPPLVRYTTADNQWQPINLDGRLVGDASLHFASDNSLMIVSQLEENEAARNRGKALYRLSYYSRELVGSIPFELDKQIEVIEVVASSIQDNRDPTFVVRGYHKNSDQERLYHYSADNKELKRISADFFRFSQLTYSGSTLLFQASGRRGNKTEDGHYWYKANRQGKFHSITTATFEPYGQSLIFEGDEGIKRLHFGLAKLESITKDPYSTFGFQRADRQLILSELTGGYYQLYTYDLETGRRKPLAIGRSDTSKTDVVLPEWSAELLQARQLVRESKVSIESDIDDQFDHHDYRLTKNTKKFRLQQAAAAAAFDGNRFRYLASLFVENLFSDKVLFLNSIFLSDELIAAIGFGDLNRGYMVSAQYTDLPELSSATFNYTRTFLVDEFRQLNLFGEFEFQDYSLITSNSPVWITADEAGNEFYLLKTGLSFGSDETVWDRHGPFAGKRLFTRSEVGFNLETGDIANVDVNVDFRLYTPILPRLGLAHRIMAGFSSGDLPTIYLLGGNISFRGVGFDDLEGTKYWVFSQDLRVPLLDFVGAKLPDPIDYAIGWLLRYFDVRGGIYGDVGSIWFDDHDLIYSVGYFINIPTIFGLNFRFNQGIFGEDAIGIWLGVNW